MGAVGARVGTSGATLTRAGLGATLALLLAAPAQALTITNFDEVPHVLTVIENGRERQVNLEPGQDADAVCAGECVVRLKSGEEYEFLPGDMVVIDGGMLFLDEPVEGPDFPRQDPPASP